MYNILGYIFENFSQVNKQVRGTVLLEFYSPIYFDGIVLVNKWWDWEYAGEMVIKR
jgi:hypothetical protein